MNQKPPPPIRSKAHLAFIRELGCVIDGRPAEAAHIRFADIARGKPHTPMARKPGDNWVLPLCPECHRTGPDAQHRGNERAWWAGKGIAPPGTGRGPVRRHGGPRDGLARGDGKDGVMAENSKAELNRFNEVNDALMAIWTKGGNMTEAEFIKAVGVNLGKYVGWWSANGGEDLRADAVAAVLAGADVWSADEL